jgi:hypothetical protein
MYVTDFICKYKLFYNNNIIIIAFGILIAIIKLSDY